MTSESAKQCKTCGADLLDHNGQFVCPACLLQQGMRSSTTAEGLQSWNPPSIERLETAFPGLEFDQLLGQGGMGAVYRVRQKELDRAAALKVLPEVVSNDAGFKERFLREARLLASLSHPHIVTVYEFGQRDGIYFLLMEYVDGVTLRQASLADPIKRLSPKEALAVVGQLCDALQFAHDEGVVHRDIKPENILIDKRGRVKIADFGLAKLLGKPADLPTLTRTHQLLGTPAYMAPEQVEGQPLIDHRADIYSVGVVFYELLTGELPLGRFQPPSAKAQLDARLDEVVLRTLEKEPDRRYQHASEVRTDVNRINQNQHREALKRKRAPIFWGLVGVAIGLAIPVGLSYWSMMNDRTKAWSPFSVKVDRGGEPDEAKRLDGTGGFVAEDYQMPAEQGKTDDGMEMAMGAGGPANASVGEMTEPEEGGFGMAMGGEGGYAGDYGGEMEVGFSGEMADYGGEMGGYPGSGGGMEGYGDFEMGGIDVAQPFIRLTDGAVQVRADFAGLDAEKKIVVEELLTQIHNEYVTLEQQHSIRREVPGGGVSVTVLAFPTEWRLLENRLWDELDAVLTVPQQRAFRVVSFAAKLADNNVGYPGGATGFSSHAPTYPDLLGWDQSGGIRAGDPIMTIQLQRKGAWHIWELSSPGSVIEFPSDPELPAELQRFTFEPTPRDAFTNANAIWKSRGYGQVRNTATDDLLLRFISSEAQARLGDLTDDQLDRTLQKATLEVREILSGQIGYDRLNRAIDFQPGALAAGDSPPSMPVVLARIAKDSSQSGSAAGLTETNPDRLIVAFAMLAEIARDQSADFGVYTATDLEIRDGDGPARYEVWQSADEADEQPTRIQIRQQNGFWKFDIDLLQESQTEPDPVTE